MEHEIPEPENIRVHRLSKEAKIPTRGSTYAAGHDLYSTDTITIPAQGQALVGTGIALGLPQGTYARLAPRSGLALKHAISIGAGVIDADYTGEIKVLMVNQKKADYKVTNNDRIAPMIIERIDDRELQEVQCLANTERAGSGFGSSDLNAQRPTVCFTS